MTHPTVNFKAIRDEAFIPEYKTAGSAAMDLRADIPASVALAPGDWSMIPVGIAIEPTDPWIHGFVFPRSGLAGTKGITIRNSVGVIDNDYRGELMVPLVNNSDLPYTVQPGDAIAQLAFMPVAPIGIAVVDELSDTARGEAGFGSTGR